MEDPTATLVEPKGGPYETVGLVLEVWQREKLDELATSSGHSRSEVVRQLLTRVLRPAA